MVRSCGLVVRGGRAFVTHQTACGCSQRACRNPCSTGSPKGRAVQAEEAPSRDQHVLLANNWFCATQHGKPPVQSEGPYRANCRHGPPAARVLLAHRSTSLQGLSWLAGQRDPQHSHHQPSAETHLHLPAGRDEPLALPVACCGLIGR